MAKTLTTEAMQFLVDVPAEYVFWCEDGRVLRNLKDLADALATMSDETFAHHANTEKNDFSRWVRDIIKDEWLAMLSSLRGLARYRCESLFGGPGATDSTRQTPREMPIAFPIWSIRDGNRNPVPR